MSKVPKQFASQIVRASKSQIYISNLKSNLSAKLKAQSAKLKRKA